MEDNKRWEKSAEEGIWKAWQSSGIYRFNVASKKQIFSIDTPPPYVNSPIHIGHAATYVLMDMFARFHRMIGDEVLFPLGLDRNGLPIEMAAEKKFKVRLTEISREKAVEHCEQILEESSLASTLSFARLGISFNSWEQGKGIGEVYYTDSDDFRQLTQETFIDLWNKGLIYEDSRLNNFCPGCQTTLADSEVQRKEAKTFLNEVTFTVKETGEKMVIATTRPELLCTAGIVIFNPEDKRYQHLEGKTARVPLYNLEVPITAHPMADPAFGTGLVFMSLSAGDQDAIRFLIEMNLQQKGCINTKGKMTEAAGFLQGLSVKDARRKIIEMLDAEGYLQGKKEITNSIPICERSKDEIQFIAMPELYLKQLHVKEKMLELANQLNCYADSSRQILLDWIHALKIDWPISRQRFYATEIPLWYCMHCKHAMVPEKGKYYKPWKEPAPFKACPQCHGKEFRGETRVFDTWFDSSITPLYILKYERDSSFFARAAPCTLRPQGKEIVRTWLYYTLLKDYLLTDQCIFRDVWIHFHIVDDKGHKMSKSVGNVIDPKEILDRYGAEPFRLWCAVEGNLDKTDFRCSFDRIEGAGKTLTKLWNVARFIQMFPKPEGDVELQEVDRWVLHEISRLVVFSRECYARYDFHNPATQLKHFLWETFASHYMELVKNRAYNDQQKFTKAQQNGALFALHTALELLLQLFAPVIPFITKVLYEQVSGKDMGQASFPEPLDVEPVAWDPASLIDLNTRIWKAKKEAGKSLKEGIDEFVIPASFRGLEADLKETHRIGVVKYG
ncbi:valine--tRNA ligase [Candidatus Woesearchaeota archaeon]|nr:valine--tRNA ligase [Candidatus Woesearchaeota archaeon]